MIPLQLHPPQNVRFNETRKEKSVGERMRFKQILSMEEFDKIARRTETEDGLLWSAYNITTEVVLVEWDVPFEWMPFPKEGE